MLGSWDLLERLDKAITKCVYEQTHETLHNIFVGVPNSSVPFRLSLTSGTLYLNMCVYFVVRGSSSGPCRHVWHMCPFHHPRKCICVPAPRHALCLLKLTRKFSLRFTLKLYVIKLLSLWLVRLALAPLLPQCDVCGIFDRVLSGGRRWRDLRANCSLDINRYWILETAQECS